MNKLSDVENSRKINRMLVEMKTTELVKESKASILEKNEAY